MTARSDLLTTLQSREAIQINFTIEGIPITGADYTYIALILMGLSATHRLGVVVGPLQHHLAGAEYDNINNNFIFPQDRTDGRSAIHEATHAILDIHHAPRRRLFNEAIAFVAGAIYDRRVAGWGTSPRLTTHYHPATSREVFEAADILAESIILQGNNYPRSELQNLYDIISHHPLYLNDLIYDINNNG